MARPGFVVACGVVALALPAGASGAIRWHSCGQGQPKSVQCGELSVPLDYAKPSGAKIRLGFNRLRASDRAHRVGSLVLNPGGPGGAGSEVVAAEAAGLHLWDPRLHRRFDLIGMDPRGIGPLSTPVRCDPAVINQPAPLFPSTADEFARLMAHSQAVGESCLRLTGPLLGHVDTKSVARDMEALRHALGEGKLNYLGLSYGAALGAQYAELYPRRIRVMALDGALEHSLSPQRMFVDATMAYEDTFNRFVSWCARTTACALHGRDAAAVFDALAAAHGGELRLNAETPLLTKEGIKAFRLPGWSDFATALAGLEKGGENPFASQPASGDGGLGGLAVLCLDYPFAVTSYEEFTRDATLARALAPHTQGASEAWQPLTSCAHWPVPVGNPPHRLRVRGAPRILLANATHDPSTPYVWAQGLASQMPSAVLVTREGDGHTSSWLKRPSRTRDAIVRYLITRRTPPPGTVYGS